MNRRDVLRAAGTGTVAGLAGCSSLPFGGGGCGPGADKIGAVAERAASDGSGATTDPGGSGNDSGGTSTATEVAVKGSITKATKKEVRIEDGTGTASLRTLIGGFKMKNVEQGDCAQATGFPVGPGESDEVDVVIIVKNIGLANG